MPELKMQIDHDAKYCGKKTPHRKERDVVKPERHHEQDKGQHPKQNDDTLA
jgi:hypothetical protein